MVSQSGRAHRACQTVLAGSCYYYMCLLFLPPLPSRPTTFNLLSAGSAQPTEISPWLGRPIQPRLTFRPVELTRKDLHPRLCTYSCDLVPNLTRCLWAVWLRFGDGDCGRPHGRHSTACHTCVHALLRERPLVCPSPPRAVSGLPPTHRHVLHTVVHNSLFHNVFLSMDGNVTPPSLIIAFSAADRIDRPSSVPTAARRRQQVGVYICIICNTKARFYATDDPAGAGVHLLHYSSSGYDGDMHGENEPPEHLQACARRRRP